MKRRAFIAALGGAAAWPIAARAQQGIRLRRIGVLLGLSAKDPEEQLRIKAFESAWPELGWAEGRNIHVDYRWAPGDIALMRTQASELVATAPEVILAEGTSVLAALLEATQSIPIVFFGVSDPEGAGLVTNLARPGGHLTGFANFEPAMGGKWLQTLKEIAPHLTRVGIIRNAAAPLRFWWWPLLRLRVQLLLDSGSDILWLAVGQCLRRLRVLKIRAALKAQVLQLAAGSHLNSGRLNWLRTICQAPHSPADGRRHT